MKVVHTTSEDALGEAVATQSKVKGLIDDRYLRAMKEVYSPKEMQAITDYSQIVKTLARSKSVPGAVGSDTASAMNLGLKAAGHVLPNWASAPVNLLRAVSKAISAHEDSQIMGYVKEALLDPDKARILVDIAKGNRDKTLVRRLENDMSRADKLRAASYAVGTASRPYIDIVMGPKSDRREWGSEDAIPP
jgi:predicted AAA+ superfamily ATPase